MDFKHIPDTCYTVGINCVINNQSVCIAFLPSKEAAIQDCVVFFCALINFVYVSNSYTDTYSHTHIHICYKSMKSYEIMLKILINFIGQVWRRSTIQVKACIRSRGMLAQAGIKAIKDCNKRFG